MITASSTRGFDDSLDVEWEQRAQVDNLCADALAGQGFRRSECVVHTASVADQAHVGAGPLDVGLAQRNREPWIDGNRPLLALQTDRFDEQAGILVEDRRGQ